MNPPSALHSAMSRDRKPFTYTPGGLDLSEIKSQRMAQRLMRNAMNPGVPEVPVHPVLPSNAPTVALPNFNCMPVQVFPAMPANPKTLLRTRSNPDPRDAPIQRAHPPASVNNTKFENNETLYKNTPAYSQQINNNRPVSMYEYGTPSANAYNAPRLSYGSDGYTAPAAVNAPAPAPAPVQLPAFSYAPVAAPVQTPVHAPGFAPVAAPGFSSVQAPGSVSGPAAAFAPVFSPGPTPVFASVAAPAPVLPEISYEAELFSAPPKVYSEPINEQLPKLETSEEKDIVPTTESVDTSIDLTVNTLEGNEVKPVQDVTVDLSQEVTVTPITFETKLVEENADIDNEQREVKVVKKQVTKKVEEQNGDQNGDANGEAEMTIKLPTKKSGAKTETKVEVVKRSLPDGSIEEVKTTTTRTTIDGRTEIKTKTETTIIPKEEDSEEEVVEEEEEEGEAVVQEVEEQQEESEEPETVTVTQTISAPKETSTVVKTEERSETTTAKKVVVVQESQPEPEEVEEEEEIEEEGDEVEAVETIVLKKPAPEPEVEPETVEEEVEEKEEAQPEEQEVVQEEVKQEVKQEVEEEEQVEEVEVKEVKAAPADEEEVEEEEEYEEAEEKQEAEVKPEEKTEEPKVEEQVEEEVKEELSVEKTVEEPKEAPKEEEHVIPVQVQASEEPKPEPKEEKPEEKPAEFTIPIREPSVPLEKVEDVEIKPIGITPIITKTHTENTEIITSTIDPAVGLSKQTEYNKIENIVTVNRTTKILDHSYENLTQQGIPTVRTYFPPPSIDRISSSPMPSRPYQPVYPPEPTTERRHSLLLERLSMERQMPSDIYQYNNQSYDQTQYQGEPQSEVLTVSNVKPSTITNQQWYQQNKQTQNTLYNNVSSTTTPSGAPWAQPKSPQPQQQYQPQPQYQPAPQPTYQAQYQPPPTPQFQRGTTPQPQFQRGTTPQPQFQKAATPQPAYQPSYTEQTRDRTPTNSYSSYTPTPTWVASAVESTPTQYNTYLNKDTTQSYQKSTLTSTQQYSSSYVPPPWEQDSSYTSVNNTSEKFYQEVPQTNTYSPAPSQGWKPAPPPAKFNKNQPIAYVPPAPNQSFVKPVSVEPPRQPGRKTYYSEYERRYITVPESTYIPTETKYQAQPDPSPQYYYDNNEPAETVEPQWRKELREFTEKTSLTQTTEQTNVQPPWEADPKYAKTPAATYTPTPTWSQTLRPQSNRERSFESEFVSQEWPKTNTLGRGRPLSTIGKSVDSAVPERARGVSVDRYNPNSYQSPAEHPPVQTHTLTTPVPHAGYHNPNVPAYHARASAEPREQPANYQQRVYREARASPLQSRSFKYLQWITGTEN
ncbi:uncharacterized protein LOC142982310 [Anticarsia gemmatalis]|uniref:uncharacterized protein LOC142982310 n=1 Tax=Anticarsia gemmatalis TaxID=129554 RepID=UPI003F765A48